MDGRFPLDFATPMTLAHFMTLPEDQLERLLEEYEIPISDHHGGYSVRGRGSDSIMGRESLLPKLSALLDFLGARHLADIVHSRSSGSISGSRRMLMDNRR